MAPRTKNCLIVRYKTQWCAARSNCQVKMTDSMTKVANDVSGRRKATMACEGCRRRRAKCSGSQPCDYCKTQDIVCIFDTQRQRRGPRPRTKSIKPNVPLAPLPKEGQTPASNAVSDDTASEGISSSAQEAPRFDTPPLHLWRNSVEGCLDPEFAMTDPQYQLKADLICHLIELFWTHVDIQQTSCISSDEFFTRLQSQQCPAYLCFAMSAAGAEYLNHKAARSSLGPGQGSIFAQKARQALIIVDEDGLLCRVQALCVLAIYEMHRGSGVQAWADLALARSFVQITKTQPAYSDQLVSIQMVDEFLQTMETYHLLGNHKLSRTCGYGNESEHKNTTQLSRLLQLAVRIQVFVDSPSGNSIQTHWHSDSQFRGLQTEVDQYPLQQPDEFSSTRESLHEWLAQGLTDRIHCVLIWQYCTIILNRGFLPIRMTRSHPEDTESSDWICYPAAPKHFLTERKNVCEGAASTISKICNEVMVKGCLFPTPLMGYTCFHSALVLLNRWHAAPTQAWNDAMQHLQINFTLLGAMKRFYLPAELWIDTLLKTQQSKPSVSQSANAELFESYFSRFEGLVEPALVPLTMAKTRTNCPSKPRTSKLIGNTTPSAFANMDHDNVRQLTWLDEYQSHLKEQMAVYETNGDSLRSVADSAQFLNSQSPKSVSQTSQALDLTVSTSSSVLRPLTNGSTSPQLPQPDNDSSSEQRLAVKAAQEKILAKGPPISNMQPSRLNAASNGGSLSPNFHFSEVHISMDTLQGSDLVTQNAEWIQPQALEFSNEADMGSILFEQLESGQSWVDTQMAAVQIPSWMDQWAGEFHIDLV